MSVIIKDMEVPQYCGACHVGFCKQIGCELYIGFDDYATSRHPDCPISNIPTPHGRLIDADALHYSRIRIAHKEHPLVTNEMKIREVFGDNAVNSILSLHPSDIKRWLAEPYKERES